MPTQTRSAGRRKRVCLEQVGLFRRRRALREVGVHTFELPRYVDAMVTDEHRCGSVRRSKGRVRGHPLDPECPRCPGRGAGLKADCGSGVELQGRTLVAVACAPQHDSMRPALNVAERPSWAKNAKRCWADGDPRAHRQSFAGSVSNSASASLN